MRSSESKPISIWLYLAGLATVICGIATLNSALSDSAFTALTTTLICIGYITSMVLRKLNYTARIVELAIVAAALIIYVQLIAGQSLSDIIIPAASASSPELKLAAMLLWLEVLRSFTLVTDDAVAFSAIPSVVLISLSATSNINADIMAYFVVYLVLASFLLTHRPYTIKKQLNSTFRTSLGISILALVIGLAAVLPVRMCCKKAFNTAMPGFTRVKSQFSLSSYGDSTETLRIAQGPISLSKLTVMTVRVQTDDNVDQPPFLYWRGRVFDYYTGHGWQISSSYKTKKCDMSFTSPTAEKTYQFGKLPLKSKRLIRQTVEIRPTESNDAYAASEPVALITSQAKLEKNDFNCWKGIQPKDGASAYTIISELPITDPTLLRKAGARYDSEIRQKFLQRSSSTHKVGELAREITKGIDNNYDKVDAIQKYLGEHCIYDLNAQAAPHGSDPVEFFVFQSKTGYCDVFASSMVVMCREAGIPARLATGFATGEYNTELGFYQVREMDRHAWVEVYFPKYGWVPFDPTEYSNEANKNWYTELSGGFGKLISDLFGASSTLALTVILLCMCAVIAFSSEFMKVRRGRESSAPSKLHETAVSRYLAIQKTIGASGIDVTPMEVASSPTLLTDEARRLAKEASSLFSEIRYSQREVTQDDIKRLETLRRELAAAIKAGKHSKPN